jgi:membrane protease subunit HflK
MERVPTSLMVTGDSNLIEIEAVAHYRVSDPFAFLYTVADPQNLVRDAALSALRGYINRNPVDFLITEGKDRIQTEALASAQVQLDAQGAGIKLLALQVTRDTPPADVLEAFRDVASAREDKNTYINEALAYQAELLPKTRGDAQKALEEATAYKERKIRMSSGEAARFLAKAKAYRTNPGVTEKRMYIEAMEKNLVSINKLIVDKRVKVDTTDLWFTNGNPLSMKKEAGNDE